VRLVAKFNVFSKDPISDSRLQLWSKYLIAGRGERVSCINKPGPPAVWAEKEALNVRDAHAQMTCYQDPPSLRALAGSLILCTRLQRWAWVVVRF